MPMLSSTSHPKQFSTGEKERGSNEPFRPGQLYMSILFLPFVGIYILSCMNWRRLGHPEYVWRTLIFGAVGVLVALVAPPLFMRAPVLVLGFVAYNPLISIYITEWQRKYYDLWVVLNRGEPPIFQSQGGLSTLAEVILLALIAGTLLYLMEALVMSLVSS